MPDEEGIIHLVNSDMDWHLGETATGKLTDGRVSEDLQRDRVRQIVQRPGHFPEQLPKMEALTVDGQLALEQARTNDRKDSGRRW